MRKSINTKKKFDNNRCGKSLMINKKNDVNCRPKLRLVKSCYFNHYEQCYEIFYVCSITHYDNNIACYGCTSPSG